MAQFIDLLREHVKTPFLSAFAYGSAVFNQHQAEARGNNAKMIDYLVVVEDNELTKWHRQNRLINPQDYPFVGRIALENFHLFDGSVYYIPDVQVSSQGANRIKYGVVGWDVLRRDLYSWNSLFLAGRLQKPTIRYDSGDALINEAMEFNLISALRVSLLQLSNHDHFDFNHILHKIVALSYTNDPRLLLAESPRKVENIVRGQREELEAMYLEKYETAYGGCRLKDPAVKLGLLANLPFTLKCELQLLDPLYPDLWRIALSEETPRLVTEAVGRIVRRSAWRQMALGAISTPVGKAFRYALRKMSKRLGG